MRQRPVRLLGNVYMLAVSSLMSLGSQTNCFFAKKKNHTLPGQLIITLARQLLGMFIIIRRRHVNLTPTTTSTTTGPKHMGKGSGQDIPGR